MKKKKEKINYKEEILQYFDGYRCECGGYGLTNEGMGGLLKVINSLLSHQKQEILKEVEEKVIGKNEKENPLRIATGDFSIVFRNGFRTFMRTKIKEMR